MAPSRCSTEVTPGDITLTDSQLQQLRDFFEEKGHSGSTGLRQSPNLGDGYVEAVLQDAEGEQTNAKRVLFPAG
jgi:hypothetical protein